MVKNLEVPGVKCDTCGKEKAFLGTESYRYTKVTLGEMYPGDEENSYKVLQPKDIFLCEDCSSKLRRYIDDIKINANKGNSNKLDIHIKGGTDI